MPKHGSGETAGDSTPQGGSRDGAGESGGGGKGDSGSGGGRAYLASEIQVGMKVRVIRPIRVESSLGQELLASKRLSITDEEAFLAAGAGAGGGANSLVDSLAGGGAGGAGGRGLTWLVTGVEAYVWRVAGFDPAPAYRITFECVGIRRVEEFFANNEVGFASM